MFQLAILSILFASINGQIIPAIVTTESTTTTFDPSKAVLGNGKCEVNSPDYIGDGYCDDYESYGGEYNTADCQYDGGDCCQSTCDPTADNDCGTNDYECLDPNAPDTTTTSTKSADDTTTTTKEPTTTTTSTTDVFIPDNGICEVDDPSAIGDGECNWDGEYNSADCQYDGGDCCQSTCEGGSCSFSNFECIDPDASENSVSTSSTMSATGGSDNAVLGNGICEVNNPDYIGDGYCDDLATFGGEYNTADCEYDGGDCCQSTNPNNGNDNGYDCRDPLAPPPPLSSTTTTDFPWSTSTTFASVPNNGECEIMNPGWIGDGICDYWSGEYNTADCEYDGGDCCVDPTDDNCIDPSVNPVDDSTTTTTTTKATDDTTTTMDSTGTPAPQEPTTTDSTTTGSTTTFDASNAVLGNGKCEVQRQGWVGDGYCDDDMDEEYNTADCNWDGGDCCEQSCVDGSNECGTSNGYDCKDPNYSNGGGNDDDSTTTTTTTAASTSTTMDATDTTDSTSTTPMTTTTTTSGDPVLGNGKCEVENPSYVGDGFCDDYETYGGEYNTADCGYDGGDCCEDSCQGQSCGSSKYECLGYADDDTISTTGSTSTETTGSTDTTASTGSSTTTPSPTLNIPNDDDTTSTTTTSATDTTETSVCPFDKATWQFWTPQNGKCYSCFPKDSGSQASGVLGSSAKQCFEIIDGASVTDMFLADDIPCLVEYCKADWNVDDCEVSDVQLVDTPSDNSCGCSLFECEATVIDPNPINVSAAGRLNSWIAVAFVSAIYVSM